MELLFEVGKTLFAHPLRLTCFGKSSAVAVFVAIGYVEVGYFLPTEYAMLVVVCCGGVKLFEGKNIPIQISVVDFQSPISVVLFCHTNILCFAIFQKITSFRFCLFRLVLVRFFRPFLSLQFVRTVVLSLLFSMQ